MPVKVEAYNVVIDRPACSLCGGREIWAVKGPDDACPYQRFEDKEDADIQAAALNAAFNAGRASGIEDATPVQQCKRTEGHDGPCNGLPRKTCKVWSAE